MKRRQLQFSAAALCLALFGCSNGDATKSEATPEGFDGAGRIQPSQALADPAPTPTPQPSTKASAEPAQAPPPKAPLAVLSGIVDYRDRKNNLAVLTLGEEAPRLVRRGDRVTDEWTVDSVGSSKVVLVTQSGHSHTVLLGAGARKREVAAPAVPPPPSAPPPDQFMIERAAAEFNMPEND